MEVINRIYAIYLARKLIFYRNFGIVIAFTLLFMFAYLYATENIAAKSSKGEILTFQRGHLSMPKKTDIESLSSSREARTAQQKSIPLPHEISYAIQNHTAVFQWKDICFDIKMKKETRRILDHVDGWVKPGTLTALMVRNPPQHMELN